MKTKILAILVLLLIAGISYSQHKDCCEDGTTASDNPKTNDNGKPDCCMEEQSLTSETNAPNIMASFSNDPTFRDAHPNPIAFTLLNQAGTMVTFKTADGTDGQGYEVRSANPTNNWVFLFHEWYGLNDYIKKEADEVAATLGDVNVLAIDLYDGKVATNNDEAMQYVQAVDNKRAVNIIMGAKDYAGTGAVFATYGWCFGGSWSNQAAIELGSLCKACVIYYGMPEQNKERLALLKAPVLGIFATQDQKITPAIAQQFEQDLIALNVPVSVFLYDAAHGFANPSNPKHDPTATKNAKEKTYYFLYTKLIKEY